MFQKYRRALLALINVAAISATQLLTPSTAHAGAGDLFASDPTANTIRIYALDGTSRIFASGLNSPQGLTFDSFGNLFVADQGTGTIYKFTTDGTRSVFVTGLNNPVGLTFDGVSLTVAEQSANQLTQFYPDGSLNTSLPATAPIDVSIQPIPQSGPVPDLTLPRTFIVNSTSLDTITGDGHTFNYPITNARGVAVDGMDNAFVSATDGSISKVTPNTGMIAGTVLPFASGLTTPNGMAFRPKRYSDMEAGVGNLFVAETDAGLVSQYDIAGTRSVFATGGNPKFLAFELLLRGKLLNISTRLRAETGDNVLIGGFILGGNDPKTVVIRAIGPSLANADIPVPGALMDTVLELHKPDGTVVTNDNWMSNSAANTAIINDNGLALYNNQPISDNESIVVATLDPGPYTAIVRGKNGSVGVAMVEVYDITGTDPGELANISTRGAVGESDDVMIGGFIIGENDPGRVLVRAIGPSLANAPIPVPNPLMNPLLELHDGAGNLLKTNDDWADTAEGEISATGIPPTDPRESAILANLTPGNYTAIVRGSDGGTGVALVEVYHLP